MDDLPADDEKSATDPAKSLGAPAHVRGASRKGILRHYLSAIPDPADGNIVSLINPQLSLPLSLPDAQEREGRPAEPMRPARPPTTQASGQSKPTLDVASAGAGKPMRRRPEQDAPLPDDPQKRRALRLDELSRGAAQLSLENPWAAGAVGYISSGLLQCTLPHTCPDPSLQAWGRTANKRSLVIQQGYYLEKDPSTGHSVPKPIGYPYGSIPRFILAWVGREAIFKRTRYITLGNSLDDFMRELGFKHMSGGERGSRTLVRDQMRRLFAARIALLDNVDPKADLNWAMASWQLADSMQLWSRKDAHGNEDVMQGQIELSDQFYDELSKRPVPLDMRVLRTLARSTFALDLYAWLSYRAWNNESETMIPWTVLQDQFGADCAELYKFRQLFRRALAMVHAVYPEAKFNADDRKGFILMPSRTAIPKKVHALGAVADATTPRAKSARKSA